MTYPYLLAVLSLLTTAPCALLLATLRVLLALHVAVPACYLMYRLCGGQWDGLAFGARVLTWVGEVRRARVTERAGARARVEYAELVEL